MKQDQGPNSGVHKLLRPETWMPRSAPAAPETLRYWFCFSAANRSCSNLWNLLRIEWLPPRSHTLASSVHILTPTSNMITCTASNENGPPHLAVSLITFTANRPIARIPACQLPNLPKTGQHNKTGTLKSSNSPSCFSVSNGNVCVSESLRVSPMLARLRCTPLLTI